MSRVNTWRVGTDAEPFQKTLEPLQMKLATSYQTDMKSHYMVVVV